MDAENDNDQPNSSSASASSSSSNNSSSSNLLGHLPMLPFMRSTDDDEPEADGEEGAAAAAALALADGNDNNDLNEEPMPLQPHVTATTTAAAETASAFQQQPTLAPITTTASTSASANASATASTAATINSSSVGREEPMEAANNSEELGQQQPQNDIHLDDNDNNDFDVDLNLRNDETLANTTATVTAAANHQQSLSLDTSASGSAGPSSSGQQQAPQTPATLPLLLQEQQQFEQQQQQQQQQDVVEQPETEESKDLPSFDHHYHNNPNNYHHLHSNSNQQHSSSSSAFPFGYRHSNGGHHSTSNNNLYGNTMSSSNRNHGSTSGPIGNSSSTNGQVVDRIKLLYPNVNEDETPLPRCWSAHEKCLSIGLSQNNLRVHFKGKQSNDAASVRTAHPIPTACGIYYFEVKIISKGKNGYMGIGLTAQQFRMNRLPGWDKQSYGYHGDDGNSFSSSGHGQSYGPTFTTGDIIGCCVNFVNNTCFYTKNGVDLGIAFRELPTRLYPTVGLQTPGEEVDANFGQEPFKFTQIEEMMKQMRGEVNSTIYDFPLPAEQGDPTTLLQKMVHSYLVHNGYSQTAEAFGRQKPGQNQKEDMISMRNRQKILKLVMTGKMGQAIDQTMRTYPGILENNKNLLFMLKCRQFIEMINGSDVEYCPSTFKSLITTTTTTTTTTTDNKTTNSITTQTSVPNQTSVIQSTKLYQNGNEQNNSSNGIVTAETATSTAAATTTITTATTGTGTATTNTTNSSSSNTTNSATITTTTTTAAAAATTTTTINNAQNSCHITVINTDNDIKIQNNINEHCNNSNDDAPLTISKSNNDNDNDYLNDVEMENNGPTNGNICKNGNANNLNDSLDADEEMDVDVAPSVRKYSHGIERILEFGKELSQMGQQLEKENKMTDDERQMLEDAFSLIAYSNPWASPLGWQLCPTKRETVCRSLNSAILESMNYPRWSPMEYCVAHANELLKVMSQSNLGSCAFINITDVFPQN